ncbi:MAG: hypothetical protein KAT65_11785, partial [Methanophagales archaeon]|nr:hypothetical protein [Methanophagales archaeon]
SRASELSADMFERDVDEGIRDQISSNIKAKALKSKRELLEEQRKIEELNDNEEHAPSSEMYPAPNPQGAAMLMQAISGMEEGQQELFFERIKDPQVAHNLALILNPPKQTMYGVAPNMPNPMGMALQSITGQPQVSSPTPEPQNQLNMADMMSAMADTMKTMQEMVLKQQPSTEGVDAGIKEALGELKQNYDKVNENIYDLKLKQIEGQAGGVSGGITKEDLDELMEQKLEGLKKSPKDTLKEIKEMILEVDTLRNSIKGELPEQREPFEEWHKRHELEREAAKDKAESDKKVKEIERDTERYKAIHQTLQDGIREAMSRKPKEKEEGGEEKIEIPLKKKVTLVR